MSGVDLHLHTTASDGRATPVQLVERAAAAGLAVIAVTDHDTTAAVAEAQACGSQFGLEVVPGIEVTAVEEGRDVHVLGYFIDSGDPAFAEFLKRQRAARLARVERIVQRLADLGMPIDLSSVLAEARAGGSERAVGRPLVARALVAAGYAADTREAFDRWLGENGPAFVPRAGAPVGEVVAAIHGAGGLASFAHPGRTRLDHRLPAYRAAGLDAIEVFHPDHGPDLVARYAALADQLGALVTGGSDYHGDPAYGVVPGAVRLPDEAWSRLREAVSRGGSR